MSRLVLILQEAQLMLTNLRDALWQCCDLETMVSRLKCTGVHFVQVLVSVSRPDGQGRSLGLET